MVSTHTPNTMHKEKGQQYPERRTTSVEQGCDAQPMLHGAIVMDQIRELRAMQTHLQDCMRHFQG